VKGEENDNDTWLNFYKHTGLALKQAKVALIRLDHTGKDGTKGERGGSAKRGDVDASWLLTETVKGERYRLECVKNRFQLAAKELALKRHDDPLCHTVEDIGVGGGEEEAKIRELIGVADRDDLPVETGARKFRKWMIERNLKGGKHAMEEAIRRRKNRDGLAFEPSQTSPPRPRGHPISATSPPRPPAINGNGHNPLSDVPPNGGGHHGDASNSRRPPLSLSIREGTGEGSGQKPGDEPCTECGEPLGWSMVRRGLTVHVPQCSAVMR
jgi:hypothetical protein